MAGGWLARGDGCARGYDGGGGGGVATKRE